MGKVVPVQDNFSAGEITRRLIAQTINPAYKNGVRSMINWTPKSQGPVVRRWGTRFVAQHDSGFARVFGFPITTNLVANVTITGDGNMYISDMYQPVYDNNVLPNGNFHQGATYWSDSSYNAGYLSFATGSVRLVPGQEHGPTNDAVLKETITVVATDTYIFELFCLPVNNDSELRLRVGTTNGGSDLISVDLAPGENSFVSEEFVPGVTAVYIRIAAPDNSYGGQRILSKVSVRKASASNQISFITPWDESELESLQVDMPPGENKMYFVSRTQAPQELSYNISTDAWSFGAVTLTGS